MRFVGIDQAYKNVGLVILDDALDPLQTKAYPCPFKSIYENAEGYTWHLDLAEELLEKDDIVCIEGLGFGGGAYSQQGAGVYAIWMAVAFRKCSITFVVPPLRVKYWAVGSTKASKWDMKNWAAQELGRPDDARRVSQHVADALAIAQIGFNAHLFLEGAEDLSLVKHKMHVIANRKHDGTAECPGKFYYRGKNGG